MERLVSGSLQPLWAFFRNLISHLGISSNAAGLVYLAILHTVPLRSALTGTSSLLDALIICPGAYREHDAPSLNRGEYPACAAMTTGFVFRVENEATVLQLQRFGKPGHLTTLTVQSGSKGPSAGTWHACFFEAMRDTATLCYAATLAMTVCATLMLVHLEELQALLWLAVTILTRLVSVVIFRRRAQPGWKGIVEPGAKGDLLVLLSQDRWIRLRGLVDDIKAVTSGQWLRDMTPLESSAVSATTLVVWLSAGFSTTAGKDGQVVLLALLFCSAGMLGLANLSTRVSCMYGRQLQSKDSPERFERRLDLAEQLIQETGRQDWALRLGMIQPKTADDNHEHELGPKIM
ncbi:uncharacterized protein LTR77_000472 [Saxophila tyrrhenica]|uniref:ABC transmembrane type-1 domain-containing protein n=1 Tax=Saxophila tyrrhenica TaxID=1690608 RepID=A0AAV9PN37_9PEZI|nr:hypothetical protein LTR77_000472 [Saxophila tyrrhenica]